MLGILIVWAGLGVYFQTHDLPAWWPTTDEDEWPDALDGDAD